LSKARPPHRGAFFIGACIKYRPSVADAGRCSLDQDGYPVPTWIAIFGGVILPIVLLRMLTREARGRSEKRRGRQLRRPTPRPVLDQHSWVPSLVLDLLNGVRTALGNRGFVCGQTCCKTALAGLSRCADFIDITPAGIHSLPQVVGGRFSLICHFVQSGCTSVTDLVLMRLHAIHEAALPRRDSAAKFLHIFAAGSL
jgi:hypothetical protein